MDRALKKCNNTIITLEELEYAYMSVAAKRWMLVVDTSFMFLPSEIKDFYKKHEDNCIVFNGFAANPKYEDVCCGVEICKRNGCALIVAIGGGSTIDVAKCIKLFSGLNSQINFLEQKNLYEKESDINLIAMPTTAGTGSESTKHAVIYYEGVKQSICSAQIIPDLVVLEPSVLKTLPLKQKSATMLDALCQACESWWSKNATKESIGYSKCAIERIIRNWKAYNIDGYDKKVALEMLQAANYAGRAINITATTAAHAMSYKLSSLYNLPHGIAVALCFPIVWRYMIAKDDEHLNAVFKEIADMFKCNGSIMGVLYFEKILTDLEIKHPISNNKERDVKILVDSVNPERLSNNPIAFKKEELREMYEEIIDES